MYAQLVTMKLAANRRTCAEDLIQVTLQIPGSTERASIVLWSAGPITTALAMVLDAYSLFTTLES